MMVASQENRTSIINLLKLEVPPLPPFSPPPPRPPTCTFSLIVTAVYCMRGFDSWRFILPGCSFQVTILQWDHKRRDIIIRRKLTAGSSPALFRIQGSTSITHQGLGSHNVPGGGRGWENVSCHHKNDFFLIVGGRGLIDFSDITLSIYIQKNGSLVH